MAPGKPSHISKTSSGASRPGNAGFIIACLMSTISYAKSKINALRSQRATKIIKPKATTRTTKQQNSLKRALSDHLIDSEQLPKASTAKASAAKASTARAPATEAQRDSAPSSTSQPDSAAPSSAPPHPTLTARHFELGSSLGRGNFGRVYLARHLTTNYICALKMISKAQCAKYSEEKLIRRELEIHQNLAHKNILKLLSWFHDDESIYLVLEYAVGGCLYTRLKKQPKGRFDEKTAAGFIAQMAEALRYMHAKNIIHRDIKPENILLGLHSEIKLADFGYSVHSESGLRSTLCGTIDYLSPEVALMTVKPGQSEEYYTKAIDQWTLGILMYELLVGKPPFEAMNGLATQRKIAGYKGKGVKFPRHISQRAEDLIGELLNIDAEKRMGLDDVLRHPWIAGHVGKSAQ
ncbi:Pkinase-domain-containing protein [Plenodomus tracheiphilus IPT5]|uniref:Aurora kinase n=1 Tax=Plenodomus tracheiphilus IPT5 TaxID=1408161 RepID=A0A6A7B070_9PLEO|nr:Pkinase-domain-containing protein [Plenodomus tracheiphilus IPT5]